MKGATKGRRRGTKTKKPDGRTTNRASKTKKTQGKTLAGDPPETYAAPDFSRVLGFRGLLLFLERRQRKGIERGFLLTFSSFLDTSEKKLRERGKETRKREEFLIIMVVKIVLSVTCIPMMIITQVAPSCDLIIMLMISVILPFSFTNIRGNIGIYENNKVNYVLPPFPKDLPCYCSYRYQGGSICVGCVVGKVGERKGLR